MIDSSETSKSLIMQSSYTVCTQQLTVNPRKPFLFIFAAGGCGAMYEIFVESEDFRGKRQVQQHRLVNKVSISESSH